MSNNFDLSTDGPLHQFNPQFGGTVKKETSLQQLQCDTVRLWNNTTVPQVNDEAAQLQTAGL